MSIYSRYHQTKAEEHARTNPIMKDIEEPFKCCGNWDENGICKCEKLKTHG